jgi:hypothetical protein
VSVTAVCSDLQNVRRVYHVFAPYRRSLPVAFPEEPPIIRIIVADGSVTHPWLDAYLRVIGSPEVNSWDKTKNLGAVLLSVIQHFSIVPPKFVPGPAFAPTSGGAGPQQGGQPSRGTGAAAPLPPAPAPAPPRRVLQLPQVPDSFPDLESLSLAELETLKADAAERRQWIKVRPPACPPLWTPRAHYLRLPRHPSYHQGHETLGILQALRSSQRDGLLATAASNLELQVSRRGADRGFATPRAPGEQAGGG